MKSFANNENPTNLYLKLERADKNNRALNLSTYNVLALLLLLILKNISFIVHYLVFGKYY